jgi:hypothetical protein
MRDQPPPHALVDDRPAGGVFRVHRDAFCREDVSEFERATLFERGWVYLGHEHQLPLANDYLTTTIGRGATPACTCVATTAGRMTARGATSCCAAAPTARTRPVSTMPDDTVSYEDCQRGMRSGGVQRQQAWLQGHARGAAVVGAGADEQARALAVAPATSASGTFALADETVFHGLYRAWAEGMRDAGAAR